MQHLSNSIRLLNIVSQPSSSTIVNEVVQAMMIEIDRRKNDNRPRHRQFQIDSGGSSIASVELVEKGDGGWQVHVCVRDAAAARRVGLGTNSGDNEADVLDALKYQSLNAWVMTRISKSRQREAEHWKKGRVRSHFVTAGEDKSNCGKRKMAA